MFKIYEIKYIKVKYKIYVKILLTSVPEAGYSTYKTESPLQVSKVSDSSFENLKISFEPIPTKYTIMQYAYYMCTHLNMNNIQMDFPNYSIKGNYRYGMYHTVCIA